MATVTQGTVGRRNIGLRAGQNSGVWVDGTQIIGGGIPLKSKPRAGFGARALSVALGTPAITLFENLCYTRAFNRTEFSPSEPQGAPGTLPPGMPRVTTTFTDVVAPTTSMELRDNAGVLTVAVASDFNGDATSNDQITADGRNTQIYLPNGRRTTAHVVEDDADGTVATGDGTVINDPNGATTVGVRLTLLTDAVGDPTIYVTPNPLASRIPASFTDNAPSDMPQWGIYNLASLVIGHGPHSGPAGWLCEVLGENVVSLQGNAELERLRAESERLLRQVYDGTLNPNKPVTERPAAGKLGERLRKILAGEADSNPPANGAKSSFGDELGGRIGASPAPGGWFKAPEGSTSDFERLRKGVPARSIGIDAPPDYVTPNPSKGFGPDLFGGGEAGGSSDRGPSGVFDGSALDDSLPRAPWVDSTPEGTPVTPRLFKPGPFGYPIDRGISTPLPWPSYPYAPYLDWPYDPSGYLPGARFNPYPGRGYVSLREIWVIDGWVSLPPWAHYIEIWGDADEYKGLRNWTDQPYPSGSRLPYWVKGGIGYPIGRGWRIYGWFLGEYDPVTGARIKAGGVGFSAPIPFQGRDGTLYN